MSDDDYRRALPFKLNNHWLQSVLDRYRVCYYFEASRKKENSLNSTIPQKAFKLLHAISVVLSKINHLKKKTVQHGSSKFSPVPLNDIQIGLSSWISIP